MRARARKIAAAGALLGAASVATVGPCEPVGRPAMVVGATHGQGSAYVTAAEPRTVELEVLSRLPMQNQHIMGWGADNPQPSPGVFDWRSLDERVALITSTGAEPVLTLCCAPDWMKGGQAGRTDWTRLEVAPTEAHFDNYAALAALVAARYPQVKRFQVWNELKGFWDQGRNTWDAPAYTRLYNKVWAAVKKVRPDALIGGPYAPLVLYRDAPVPSEISGPWGTVDRRGLDAIDYWLEHAVGADFLTVDAWSITRDAGYLTDPLTATGVFPAVTRWLTARTDLPIWWSELYPADAGWPLQLQADATTKALDELDDAGASVALLWAPQATWHVCLGCLWSDPRLGPVTTTPLAAQLPR